MNCYTFLLKLIYQKNITIGKRAKATKSNHLKPFLLLYFTLGSSSKKVRHRKFNFQVIKSSSNLLDSLTSWVKRQILKYICMYICLFAHTRFMVCFTSASQRVRFGEVFCLTHFKLQIGIIVTLNTSYYQLLRLITSWCKINIQQV